MGLVKVESSEGITTITMTRADKRNALNQGLCDALYDAYCAFEAGGDQVAVLQADGPAFCVGADLKEPPAAMWKAVPDVSHKLSKPVIAVTQGWVIGGGGKQARYSTGDVTTWTATAEKYTGEWRFAYTAYLSRPEGGA